MSRPLRLEFEGALYHVTARGNERTSIFRDDRDRARFLEMLGSIAASSSWVVHAYCLMGNHFHLVVETPRANLSAGMQRLNGRYTQWFNIRHRRSGHLLQGRYHAVLVERDPHLLELCRYVVLNPVRAGLVAGPEKWAWSSYRATAGLSPAPPWLEVDETLSVFARSRAKARGLYRTFVSEGRGAPSPEDAVRHQIYLGGEDFLQEMGKRLEDRAISKDVPSTQRNPAAPDFEKIRRAVAREFRTEPEALSRRRGGEDKMAAVYLAQKHSGRAGTEVGREFGVGGARVSNIVTEIESGGRPALVRRIRKIEARLGV
ncbi:MAG TPA: transposase [Thermoanaerobaculia bacterium]|nr:transposase [Thermoanaerobaculia bacterium]